MIQLDFQRWKILNSQDLSFVAFNIIDLELKLYSTQDFKRMKDTIMEFILCMLLSTHMALIIISFKLQNMAKQLSVQ